jgi:hypothetical protein
MASYLLRLVCGALICGLILALTGTAGPMGKLRRLLCGVFMGFLAISPLREVDFRDLIREEFPVMADGAAYIRAGSDSAKEAMEAIIEERCRSYILNRAEALGLSPVVEVELHPETGLPAAVTLRCRAAPYDRGVLEEMITAELGIERSRIQWIP